MKSGDRIRTIIERFSLGKPIGPSEQVFVREKKRVLLAAVLKSVGDYGFFFGMALRVFFGARSIGLGVTLVQSMAIVIAASAILTASVTGGIAYYAVFHSEALPVPIMEENAGPAKASLPAEKELPSIDSAAKPADQVIPMAAYSLGIEPFSGNNVPEASCRSVTNSIMNRLAAIKGDKFLTYLSNKNRAGNVAMILTGSVGKIGGTYVITARVIDVANGQNIYSTSEYPASESEFDTACEKIARQIAGNIQVKPH